MRLFVFVLLVWSLAGCATQSGDASGNDAQRARERAKVHTELAGAYYENANYKIALDELGKAVRADSQYAPAYNMRGLVHMVLQEDADAEKDFRRALELDPDNSDTHNNYGWFLCQRGRERESLNHFIQAVENPLYSTPERAYLNAGICARKAGQLQDADLYLHRALTLQPGLFEAQKELAEVAFAKGDYAGARSYFAHYAQAVAAPLSAADLLLAVRIERKLGNRNAEAQYAAQLRKDFPTSREAQLMMQLR